MAEEEDQFDDAEEQFEEADEQEETNETFPLHRAAYYNDAARIRRLAASLPQEELQQQDTHGNSALHVAALCRSTLAAQALLDAGLPVDVKSRRGWTALEEALAAHDHATAKVLHTALLSAMRLEMKAKRRELLKAMRAMPDYSMNLSWRLGSAVPGLGMLLRRYAPADTYTLWKVGDRLRVDGTLMGIDTKSATLIPEWKRGHFSLILDGSACVNVDAQAAESAAAAGSVSSRPSNSGAGGMAGMQPRDSSAGGASSSPRLLFLHHGKQRWVDLGADKKAMKGEEEEALEDQLLSALERDVDKQRFKPRGFKFAPLKGWLGGEVREKVEGWQCRVYEATGKLVGVSTSKAAWNLPDGATFDDYLALQPPDDDVAEVLFDPLNPSTYDPMRPQGASDEEQQEEGEDGEYGGLPQLEARLDMGGSRRQEEPRSKGSWWGSGGGASTGRKSRSRGSSRRGSWWGSGGGESEPVVQGGSESAPSLGQGTVEEEWLLASLHDSVEAGLGDEFEDAEAGNGSSSSGAAANDKNGEPSSSNPPGQRVWTQPPWQHEDAARLQQQQQQYGGGRAGGAQGGPSSGGSKGKKKQKGGSSSGRTLRARLWMAEGFPMRLSALVPLLEVIGSANKQISKVGRFMSKYAGLDLFPVKIQVPLLLTVYALVGFSKFHELGPGQAPGPEFFEVPEGYQRRLLSDMIDKHTGGLLSMGPSGRRRQGSGEDSDPFSGLEDELDWG